MKGLSKEIEQSIEIIFKGLDQEIGVSEDVLFEDFHKHKGNKVEVLFRDKKTYKGIVKTITDEKVIISYQSGSRKRSKTITPSNFFSAKAFKDEDFLVDDDKLRTVIKGKVDAFKHVREMLKKWTNSKNAPTHEKTKSYIKRLMVSGEQSIGFFRKALTQDVDFDSLEAHKHHLATQAKPLILEAIFDLEYAMAEMQGQLEADEFDFSEREFRLGYPEKFAKQQFFPKKNYHKNWYNEKEDAVKICPFSTEGRIIELQNLKIQLPKPPPIEEMLYYDLPKEEQYWRRSEPPKITPDNIDLYHDYIMEEYRKRREGIWFMNYGEPIYITGNMYFALQWCKMSDGGIYMDFRFAQLNLFYFLEAVLVDQRCLGISFLKSRRTGFTYIALAIMANDSTSSCNEMFGMTSMSDEEATKAFGKFSYMILHMPFWLRPVIKGREDSLNEIIFAKPSTSTKESKKKKQFNLDDFLNTRIDHKPTKENSYDGQKMKLVLSDECGKWAPGKDYVRHLGIISFTMLQGGRVVGKIFSGSTIGKKNHGGEQFKAVYYNSNILDRDNTTKRTATGLYSYFLPAHENMEEYTDKYGVCWSNKPPDDMKVYNVKGRLINKGAIDELIADENAKKKADERAYNEQLRNMPRTEEHAFRDEGSSCIYNITKLQDQIEYNESSKRENELNLYKTGNFEWVDGIPYGSVHFVPDKKGRWKVAWMPSAVDGTSSIQNNVSAFGDSHLPLSDYVVAGCDPFSHASTHGKGSRGAFHLITRDDAPGDIPKKTFIVEYGARPATEFMFFEDVIKTLHFYGCKILIESNRPSLLQYMYQKGYSKFSMSRVDKRQDQLSEMEVRYGGQTMTHASTLDMHSNIIGSYIDDYVGESTNEAKRPLGEMGFMPFTETLNDWLMFEPHGGKARSKCDLAISSGLALMALNPEKYKPTFRKPKVVDLSGLFPKYDHSGEVGRKINNHS